MSDLSEARLPELLVDGGVGLGFPRIEARLPSCGVLTVGVVFVDFPDAQATSPPQAALDLISPGAEEFLRQASHGRLCISFLPDLCWRRMPKSAEKYDLHTFEGHLEYISEALALAGDAAVALAPTCDAWLIMANPAATGFPRGPALTAPRGGGVAVGDRVFDNVATSGHDLLRWGFKWFVHEFLHLLGLADLYSFEGQPKHRFVGEFSIMGLISGRAPGPLAWERWLLAWLDDDQVVCPPMHTTCTVALAPVGSDPAADASRRCRMVVVPVTRTEAVVVENRQPVGHDHALGHHAGILVYLVDTAVATGRGIVRVLQKQASDGREAVSDTVDVGTMLLSQGESLCHDAVSVHVLAQDDADGAVTVRVARSPASAA